MADDGPNKPTLQTVAAKAGVSTATVSQVLRGKGRISNATREKVEAAARRLHYVPDGRAASMRSGENREIGFIIHRMANPFNSEVISGVSDQLDTEGYLVSVLDSRDDPIRQTRNLDAFIRNTRGGLIWVPAHDTERHTVERLHTHRIPTVTFLREAPVGDFDHVGIEDKQAVEDATDYLADLGHTHIAYFGGVANEGVRRDRIAGYRRAMRRRKLAKPLVWPCQDRRRSAIDALDELRRKHPEVTALVCNGDVVAVGASIALARQGLVTGKDISIVGFDDSRDARLASPPLTTMAVAPYELGKRLARVLLDRLHTPDAPAIRVSVPARLKERESAGPPPT